MAVLPAQTIKLKNGVSITNMKADNIPFLNDYIYTYNASVGVEYLESDDYYINTELGYFQKGGKEYNPLIEGKYNRYSKAWNYLNLATTFRYKFPMKEDFLYLGVGPQLDFLLSNPKDFAETMYDEGYTLKRMSLGVVPELGFVIDRDRFRYGVEISYLLLWDKVIFRRYTPMASVQGLASVTNCKRMYI